MAINLARRMRRVGLIPTLILLMLAASSMPAFIHAAAAADFCQCVVFVQRHFSLSGGIGGNGYAKDMGPYLEARGFRRVADPAPDAVVVLQPSVLGADSVAGHVGIIASVQSVGSNWRVTLEGANQGRRADGTWMWPQYTKDGCSDVSLWAMRDYPKSQAGVAYYLPTSQPPPGTEVIVDDRSGDFVRTQGRTWYEYGAGYGQHIYWTWAGSGGADDSADWRANLASRRYEVYVHIPSAKGDANARYQVFHQGGTTVVTVNQAPYSNQWVSLGVFTFAGGYATRVRLNDDTGQAYPRMVAWDAVKFVPR